jgi:hypothetical protein
MHLCGSRENVILHDPPLCFVNRLANIDLRFALGQELHLTIEKGRACGGVIPVNAQESEIKDVRHSAWCLAASLVAVSPGASWWDQRAGPTSSINLTIGPNGPIPAIVAD